MNHSVTYQKHSVTFSPQKVCARVLMVPFATNAELIEKVLDLGENQHHAWGVKELLAADVEVTVMRRYSSWWERFGQDWLHPDTREYDLVYSNHNRLIQTPLESMLGLNKTPFVSLVYAGEPLFAANRHFGLLCMTPYAYSRFKTLTSVRVRYAPWGIDPEDDIVNLETIGAGILVEPENPEALAAAMLRLQENPELRLSMGRAGAEQVRSHLTMQKFSEPLIELVMAAREQYSATL